MHPPRFHFDYIDPASYVVDLRLRSILEGRLVGIELLPHEVRPPGTPPLDPASDMWLEYWDSITALAPDAMARLRRPSRLPHTRKAHELVCHAIELDAARGMSTGGGSRDTLHFAIFRAALEDGRDVGRVDVLVELAVEAGLDRTEARAVLDVDRYSGEVERKREAASDTGVVGVPTLTRRGELLEGVHDIETIRAFVTATTRDD